MSKARIKKAVEAYTDMAATAPKEDILTALKADEAGVDESEQDAIIAELYPNTVKQETAGTVGKQKAQRGNIAPQEGDYVTIQNRSGSTNRIKAKLAYNLVKNSNGDLQIVNDEKSDK